jgi:quinolinate synthase
MTTTQLPRVDRTLPKEEALAEIQSIKAELGDQLLILGHHYQVDDVIRFADLVGDSFKLAQLAAKNTVAKTIMFCGVHFMAESADILANEGQVVVLPDMAAGCSMADMANVDQTETAFEELDQGNLIPLTYMNSSAAIKAFVGRKGGSVCTSSNAMTVIRWALKQKERLLFLPDQHLGRNVCFELGIPLSDMAIWDPHALPEVNMANGCDRAKILLWKGHCSVHTKFLPPHVDQVRAQYPGIQVIVHPECPIEVVRKADQWGSTEKIIRVVTESPEGSVWAIGTEINLVSRLAQKNPGKTIVSLSGINCLCSTMYRVDPHSMLWVMRNLREGRVVNRIKVDAETAHWARVALDRMLSMA